MPPLRIGMLIDSLAEGGAERVAVEVACHLDPTRFEPHFVVTRSGGPLELPLQIAGIRTTILGREGGGPPVRMLARALRLLRDADLIHAHMFGSSVWGALLSRLGGVPLVTSDAAWSGQRTRVRTWGYRHWIGTRALAIVCPSAPVASSIVAEGVPAQRLRVIENGVPRDAALPSADARSELGLNQRSWVIGIVANLRAEKAHQVLLHAFSHMAADRPSATLCVVGDGERRDELRALARHLGIDERVVWAGHRQDARRLASAFDTAVICSEWEGLPLAALEVLAAGVPLVASRVGVLPEVVGGGAGVLFDSGDDAQLARELAALMDDPGRARTLGERGRRRVGERYPFERMVKEFEDVYDNVLVGP